jgi:hypothetical protein
VAQSRRGGIARDRKNMKTSIPAAEYNRMLAELAAARDRFEAISALINTHYGNRSDQASRAEQITLAIQRLEMELTRYDNRAKSRGAGE